MEQPMITITAANGIVAEVFQGVSGTWYVNRTHGITSSSNGFMTCEEAAQNALTWILNNTSAE